MTMLDMLRGFRHPPPYFGWLADGSLRVLGPVGGDPGGAADADAFRVELYDLFIKLKLLSCFRSVTVCR